MISYFYYEEKITHNKPKKLKKCKENQILPKLEVTQSLKYL